MQIVGTQCAVCHQGIAFVAEGLACPRCALTYHKECLGEDARCPQCQADLAQARVALQQAEEASAARVKKEHQLSQAILWSLAGMGFCVFRIAGRLGRDEPHLYALPEYLAIVLLSGGILVSYLRARS